MAGSFKHQQHDNAENYFRFFHELFVQHANTKQWNLTALTEFASRPAFLSVVAACRSQLDCHNCTQSQQQVQRFVQEIALLNSPKG